MPHHGSGQCLTPSTFRGREGGRREDRCPFRRRQSPPPAHQNASLLVFPDKIIAAVSINNSPMAETFAHLPACSLGRPLPFPAWSRKYLEKDFRLLRGEQTQKERPLCETAGKARQVLVSVSLFRHTRVWTTSIPFLGSLGSVSSVFSPSPLLGVRSKDSNRSARMHTAVPSPLQPTWDRSTSLLSLDAACH